MLLYRIAVVLFVGLAVAVSADVDDGIGEWNGTDREFDLSEFSATTTPANDELPMDSVSSTEMPFQPYEMRPETYMVPIIFMLIFLVGVLGNGLLVLVFVRHTAMRNVPNT